MAPARRYDTPIRQLGMLMVDARRRGLCFEEFWIEAVRPDRTLVMVNDLDPPEHCILWPTDRNDRLASRKAIMDTMEGWRRSYERETPTESELALAHLADGLGPLLGRGLPAEVAVA